MNVEFFAFTAFLAFLWFLVYWILGGVFFAFVAILHLGRIRKVRFSCLFTVLSLVTAVTSAFVGMRLSGGVIQSCLEVAQTKAEAISSVFGCGFAGVLGTFLLGGVALVLGGFAIFALSKTKTRPWIDLTGDREASSGEADDVPAPAGEAREGGFFS